MDMDLPETFNPKKTAAVSSWNEETERFDVWLVEAEIVQYQDRNNSLFKIGAKKTDDRYMRIYLGDYENGELDIDTQDRFDFYVTVNAAKKIIQLVRLIAEEVYQLRRKTRKYISSRYSSRMTPYQVTLGRGEDSIRLDLGALVDNPSNRPLTFEKSTQELDRISLDIKSRWYKTRDERELAKMPAVLEIERKANTSRPSYFGYTHLLIDLDVKTDDGYPLSCLKLFIYLTIEDTFVKDDKPAVSFTYTHPSKIRTEFDIADNFHRERLGVKKIETAPMKWAIKQIKERDDIILAKDEIIKQYEKTIATMNEIKTSAAKLIQPVGW